MGLFDGLFGSFGNGIVGYAPGFPYAGQQAMSEAERIVNQCRAEAMTRPLTVREQLLYDGAVQAVKDAQKGLIE